MTERGIDEKLEEGVEEKEKLYYITLLLLKGVKKILFALSESGKAPGAQTMPQLTAQVPAKMGNLLYLT